MMFHVMLAGHGDGHQKGLCGEPVRNFYVSKMSGEGKRRPDVCPVCRALVMKIKSSCGAAATGSAAHS